LFYAAAEADGDDDFIQLQRWNEAEEWNATPAVPVETLRRRMAIQRELRIRAARTSGYLGDGDIRFSLDSLADITALAYTGAGQPIGLAALAISQVSPGEGELRLWVEPEWRRRGVARSLLKGVCAHARKNGIGIIRAKTLSHIPAGYALMRRLGASPGRIIRHTEESVAFLRTLDRPFLGESGIRFELVDECKSGARMMEIAALKKLVAARFGNDIARLPVQHVALDVARSRMVSAAMGIEVWTIAAVRPDGSYVGFSDYSWDPEQPHLLKHLGLAVAFRYQGGQVGRALADCFRLVLDVKPSVTVVRYARLCSPLVRREHESSCAHHFETRWRVETNAIQSFSG
jgi:GNAT superfamily N-acetyltransferase